MYSLFLIQVNHIVKILAKMEEYALALTDADAIMTGRGHFVKYVSNW